MSELTPTTGSQAQAAEDEQEQIKNQQAQATIKRIQCHNVIKIGDWIYDEDDDDDDDDEEIGVDSKPTPKGPSMGTTP